VPKKKKPFYRQPPPLPKRNPRLKLSSKSGKRHSILREIQLAIPTVISSMPVEPRPFLKWVGGKVQLLRQFDEFSQQK
jgi:hypothetical protein